MGIKIWTLVKLLVENSFELFIAHYYLLGPPYNISLPGDTEQETWVSLAQMGTGVPCLKCHGSYKTLSSILWL